MTRRDLLLLAGGVAVGGTAFGGFLTYRAMQRREEAVEALECYDTLPQDPPTAVYHPTHVDGMQTIDTLHGDDYSVTLAYTFPHPFWTTSGSRVERVDASGHIHLMCVVWDQESGRVIPVDTGPSVTVTQGESTVTEGGTWPMISQQMGVHFGDNVTLHQVGETEVEVTVPPVDVELAGDYAGRFQEPETFTASFDYRSSHVDSLDCVGLEERGEPGAVGADTLHERMHGMGDAGHGDDGHNDQGAGEGEDDDHHHGHPVSRTPREAGFPGSVVGVGSSGDAEVVLVDHDEGLAVSLRTPYNRYPLPMAALSAEVTRDGSTVFDGGLSPRIHPDLGFHYHGDEALEPGDSVEISFGTPPQVSRHMGYETAFVSMSAVEFTV